MIPTQKYIPKANVFVTAKILHDFAQVGLITAFVDPSLVDLSDEVSMRELITCLPSLDKRILVLVDSCLNKSNRFRAMLVSVDICLGE